VNALAAGAVGGRPIVVSGNQNGKVRVWDLITREQSGCGT
jgi:hypothetical protein